jgi:IMP dehydrogenase
MKTHGLRRHATESKNESDPSNFAYFCESVAMKREWLEGDYALTYDDVLLVPQYSEVMPREVSLKTRLTREISLNIPIVSAAMDTVTEYRMAIAMAIEGGIGILHKNMNIEEQATQVRRVKRYESGLIVDPITLGPNGTIGEAKQIMKEHSIGGIPIVDEQNRLIGILTNRDIRFEENDQRPVKEVMTKEKLITVPEGTTLDKATEILRKYKIEKLPVVNERGELVGLITYKDIIKQKHFPNANKDALGRLRVGAAVGVGEDTLERVDCLLQAGVDVIVVDTAHGHSVYVLRMIQKIKTRFPDLQVIGGNVATGEGTKALIEAGVDAVKVGVGPGSICTTRVVAGVGVPQLTAVMKSYEVASQYNVPIIADGGIKYSGDIVKALSAGADSVMIGNLLAGTEESPGQTILYEGRKFKEYRGMGSLEAMQKGSKDRYFQDAEDDIKKLVPEGVVGRVPYKGNVSEVLYQLIGGVRAGMGYCGARTIPELRQVKFVRITHAGLRESHPHSVQITREAPNYTTR